MSQIGSSTICMQKGSHATVPGRRILRGGSRLAAVGPQNACVINGSFTLLAGQRMKKLTCLAPQPLFFFPSLKTVDCGLDLQKVKDYWSCLASVLNRASRIEEYLACLVLFIWIAIVLQWSFQNGILSLFWRPCLSKAPLHQAALERLTYKRVFLLAMAGRHNQLQALVLDNKYCLKTFRDGIMMYFSPEFMRKNPVTPMTNAQW